jgi:hypothetical protein
LDAGDRLARTEREAYRRWHLSPDVFERAFSWSAVQKRMKALHSQGFRRIVLADLGKNVYAFYRGAESAGLKVLAIADDRFSAPGRTYRGVPLLPTAEALTLGAHAYVISNTSYVHAGQRCLELAGRTSRPVFNWFDPPRGRGEVPSGRSKALRESLGAPSSQCAQALSVCLGLPCVPSKPM